MILWQAKWCRATTRSKRLGRHVSFLPLLPLLLLFLVATSPRAPIALADSDPSEDEVDGVHVAGRVGAFQWEVIEADAITHERFRIQTSQLGFPADSSSQRHVILNPIEWDTRYGILSNCHGPPCPDMGPCSSSSSNSSSSSSDDNDSAFPNLQFCSNPDMVDPDVVVPEPPLNCPRLARLTKPRRPYSGRDPSCSHQRDFAVKRPVEYGVMRLEGMFLTREGFLFNRSHQFIKGGCGEIYNFKYPASKKVLHMDSVFNWAYAPGSNFYHFLIEAFPSLFVAAEVIPTLQGVPFTATNTQWTLYDSLGPLLIGLNQTEIRGAIPRTRTDLVFAKTVYQPILQECGHPSHSLWTALRRRHLLPPTGLPLFNPDRSYRAVPPLADKQMAALPNNWIVLIAKRPKRMRSLRNFHEVYTLAKRYFDPKRVVIFRGAPNILEARKLFRRARLFIASHGAALANIIFMPTNSSVLEVRPSRCRNACYHYLAEACSVKYYILFSEGSCHTSMEVELEKTEATFAAMAERFKDEDALNNDA